MRWLAKCPGIETQGRVSATSLVTKRATLPQDPPEEQVIPAVLLPYTMFMGPDS
jgi:hypothetical protein